MSDVTELEEKLAHALRTVEHRGGLDHERHVRRELADTLAKTLEHRPRRSQVHIGLDQSIRTRRATQRAAQRLVFEGRQQIARATAQDRMSSPQERVGPLSAREQRAPHRDDEP